MEGGSEQGSDRKPVAEEQEVVVWVHPAAVCSHCVLITKATVFWPQRGHLALLAGV